jgi:exosortase/archaeosortase family protein
MRPGAQVGANPRPAGLLGATILTCVYAVALPFAPPLIRAILAILALTAFLSSIRGQRFDPALGGLLLLSLPLLASLQFYAGFPLRLLVTHLAALFIRLTGLPVVACGTALDWGGQLVAVDAPCSGIRMLWVGLYLVFALALFHRLPAKRLFFLLAAAFLILILANVWRASSLFFLEAGVVSDLASAHSLVGIAVFIGAAAMIVVTSEVVRKRPLGNRILVASRPTGVFPGIHCCGSGRFFVGACVFAAGLHLILPDGMFTAEAATEAALFPGWPDTYEGHQLRLLPQGSREAMFATGFPGAIARFNDGKREIIMRWVTRPTRKLHPATHCFRGDGYQIEPLPLGRTAEGIPCTSFRATRGSQKLIVSEYVRDDAGNHWPDVSAWYWAALFKQTAGPWWSVTVAAREG